MKNLFKKQSAKFVQNPSSFTKVMAKHILVCFLCLTVYLFTILQSLLNNHLFDVTDLMHPGLEELMQDLSQKAEINNIFPALMEAFFTHI